MTKHQSFTFSIEPNRYIVGKLAGLSASQLLDALGLAYAQATDNMQSHVEGGPALALQMAFAAAAIHAVDLAQAAFPGPHDISEGPFGYFPLYEGTWALEPVATELGSVWRITHTASHFAMMGIQAALFERLDSCR